MVFEVITGSKAYGLDTAKSDTDIRGVFVLPKDMFYGLEYTEQVNNETNDIVYYELKRFMQLLAKEQPEYPGNAEYAGKLCIAKTCNHGYA